MAIQAAREGGWILVVEDNRGDVDLIQYALRQKGIDLPVVALSDGAQAFDFLDAIEANGCGCPLLVIVDLNLPKKSGREVLARVAKSTVCATSPVVVLSSSNAEADRADSLRLGARLYISKPSNLDEFLKIGEILKGMIRPQ